MFLNVLHVPHFVYKLNKKTAHSNSCLCYTILIKQVVQVVHVIQHTNKVIPMCGTSNKTLLTGITCI